MRALILSDLHYHNWQEFSSLKEGINTRLIEIDETVRYFINTSLLDDVNILIILGDVFHKRGVVDVICHDLFHKTINYFLSFDTNRRVHILVGNHDQALITESVNSLNSFARDCVTVHSTTNVSHINFATDCLFLPYTKDHDKIQDMLEANFSVDYIFGHFAVKGAKLINTDFTLDKGVDLTKIKVRAKGIFLGHYHTPQKLPCRSPAYYVGSPLHHTFNDEGQQKRAAMIIDDKVKFIPSPAPEFKTLNIYPNTRLEDLESLANSYVRVRLHNGAELPSHIKDKLNTTAKGYKIVIENTPAVAKPISTYSTTKHIKDYLINNNMPNKTEIYKLLKKVVDDSN